MNITMISPNHRVPFQGKHNKNFTNCPECGENFGIGERLLQNTIGFCENNGQIFHVSECPNCFCKYRYHLNTLIYEAWKKLKTI